MFEGTESQSVYVFEEHSDDDRLELREILNEVRWKRYRLLKIKGNFIVRQYVTEWDHDGGISGNV